jgi:hypothetical protein
MASALRFGETAGVGLSAFCQSAAFFVVIDRRKAEANPDNNMSTTTIKFSIKRICLFLAIVLGTARSSQSMPADISFSQSAQSVEVYDFVEVTLNVSKPDAGNPFTDVAVQGSFEKASGADKLSATGFCDASDGSVFRIRFMPAAEGDYTYSLTYRQGDFERMHTGKFRAAASHRRGPIRVDPEYRWHFIWEGTKEHYFFNGTTAFWLMGWREERIINNCIERLQRLKINRLRVLLSGAEPTLLDQRFAPVQPGLLGECTAHVFFKIPLSVGAHVAIGCAALAA